MIKYTLVVLLALICSRSEAKQFGGGIPVADYSYYIEYIGFGSEVYFLNESTDALTYYWDFGDGASSTDLNPVHAYPEPGIFIVCLTATNDMGTNIFCDTLNTYYPPSADFSFEGDPTVSFTDLTINYPTTWDWFFGDGDIASSENPVHTFLANGDYNVCLSAGNPGGTSYSCKTVSIISYPVTETAFIHSGDPDVAFTDISTESPFDWSWDFGDGDSSTLQNPMHTYSDNGLYTVCLTATNAGGTNTYCADVAIWNAYDCPTAGYSYLAIDLNVAFVDTSIGLVTSTYWDFGDGGSSTLSNPVHSFADAGSYNVCMTASNASCNDITCKIVGLTTSISPVTKDDFTFYPNPVTDIFTIKYHKAVSNSVLIIYDFTGKKVPTYSGISGNKITVDCSGLVDGIYYFQLKGDHQLYGRGSFIMK